MHSSLLILLLAACTAVLASQQCQKGDAPCFCESVIGGTYKELSAPLLSSCQLNYVHQGIPREAHVYLPPSYDGVTNLPIWMHLHGVFWTTMDGIARQVGHPVNGTDIIPSWDHTIQLFGDKAIIVYPQSLGDPGTGNEAVDGQGVKYRQFWHVPFWQCSVGICRPESLDDVGFIEKVLADLPSRLPLTPGKYYLSGESAGGMMVETLLCQSNILDGKVTAAVDILGGIGADYALKSCARTSSVPYLHLHGIEDPTLTYDKRVLVDGVNFLSAVENTRLRAQRNGCLQTDAGSETSEADGILKCTDFCAKANGKPAAEICGIVGAAHDTNHPYTGFVYEQAWKFFEQQAARKPSTAAATPQPATSNKKVAAPMAARPSPSLLALPWPSSAIARSTEPLSPINGPLILVISFPDISVDQFEIKYASKALDAVSQVTGLPTKNITAAYKPSKNNNTYNSSTTDGVSNALYVNGKPAKTDDRQHRRYLLQSSRVSALSSGPGVTATYTLAAMQPAEVAASFTQAVQDGSFLAQLQDSGLVAQTDAEDNLDQSDSEASIVSRGPLVSLHAAGGRSGTQNQQPEVLLAPTYLLEVAQARLVGADGVSGSDASSSTSSRDAGTPGWGEARNSGNRSSNVRLIVGVVVGCVLGAAILVGGIWLVAAAARRRRQQHNAALPGSPNSGLGRLQSSDAVLHVVEDASTDKAIKP